MINSISLFAILILPLYRKEDRGSVQRREVMCFKVIQEGGQCRTLGKTTLSGAFMWWDEAATSTCWNYESFMEKLTFLYISSSLSNLLFTELLQLNFDKTFQIHQTRNITNIHGVPSLWAWHEFKFKRATLVSTRSSSWSKSYCTTLFLFCEI